MSLVEMGRGWGAVLGMGAAALLQVGCTEGRIGAFNAPPEAKILAPGEGTELHEGYTVELRGSVSDPDDDLEDLRVTWYLDEQPYCEDQVASDGQALCHVVPWANLQEIALEVWDPAGATAQDRIAVEVRPSEPPVAMIVAPPDGLTVYEGTPIDLQGQVSSDVMAPEALEVWWQTTTQQDPLVADVSPTSDGQVSTSTPLPVGVQTLSLHVRDDANKTGMDEVTVEVWHEHTAPSCGIQFPADDAFTLAGEPLVLQGYATHPEAPSTALEVSWFSDVDGPLSSGPVEDDSGAVAYTWPEASVGAHVLTLTVEDPLGGTCEDEVGILVRLPPDVSISAPAEGEIGLEGEVVTLHGLVDEEVLPPEDLLATWSFSSQDQTHPVSVAADGSVELALLLPPGAHTATLEVEAQGLQGSDEVTFSVNHRPSAPTVAIDPEAPDTTTDLQGVLTSPSDDPDDDVTYTWAWKKQGGDWASPDVDGPEVPATDTVRDQTWHVRAVPFDGLQEGPAGHAEVTIGNAPPEVTSVTITPALPGTTDALTCSHTVDDPDGDDVTIARTWFALDEGDEPQPFSGETGATLSPDHFERGDAIGCEVVGHDGTIYGEPASAVVLIGNTPPEVTSVSLTPDPPRVTDTLTCSADLDDADGDTVTPSYAWYRDQDVLEGADDDALFLDADETARGDEITCEVTPWDGEDYGEPMSATVTIENSPPTAPEVAITWAGDGEFPVAGEDELLCEVTKESEDPDGGAISYDMSWIVTDFPYGCDSCVQTYHEDDTIPVATLQEGQIWECGTEASDGIDSVWAWSDPVEVAPPSFVQLAAGWAHTCGLRSDGRVVCWGDNYHGQAPNLKVASEGTYVQIAAGARHTCGLRDDALIECWGRNTDGEAPNTPVEAQESQFVQVSGGGEQVGGGSRGHSCGLRDDGVVECWGMNDNGEAPATWTPPTDRAFVHISANWLRFSCATRDDGKLACLGWDNWGKAPTLRTPTNAQPYEESGGGLEHACALAAWDDEANSGGWVECWGHDVDGKAPSLVDATITHFVQLGVGRDHNCALRDDGVAECWGNDTHDQSPDHKIPAEGVFVDLAVGASHNCALRDDGVVECWGYDNSGQASPP